MTVDILLMMYTQQTFIIFWHPRFTSINNNVIPT